METIETAEPTLASRIAESTERKEAPAPLSSPSGTGAENFWGADDDIISEDINAIEEATRNEAVKEVATPVMAAPAPPTPLSPGLIELSASNAVGMVDTANRAILTPIVNWKIKKKMEKINPDLEELEKLIDSDDADLEDAGKRQKKAFERLMKKSQKVLNSIPLSEEETERGKKTFKEYFTHTGKSLPPSMMLWFFMANTTVPRAIDIIFD
jgi:hypothetical protein